MAKIAKIRTQVDVNCPTCIGTGYDMGIICQVCNGKGTIKVVAHLPDTKSEQEVNDDYKGRD